MCNHHCSKCPEAERLKCWGTTDIKKIRDMQAQQVIIDDQEGFGKDESEFWP